MSVPVVSETNCVDGRFDVKTSIVPFTRGHMCDQSFVKHRLHVVSTAWCCFTETMQFKAESWRTIRCTFDENRQHVCSADYFEGNRVTRFGVR